MLDVHLIGQKKASPMWVITVQGVKRRSNHMCGWRLNNWIQSVPDPTGWHAVALHPTLLPVLVGFERTR
jgi:hypothetical protein